MSLSWRDQIVVGFGADDISIVRIGGLGRGLRGTPIILHRAVEANAASTMHAEPLGDWCSKNRIAGCRATVILSNAFVRYTLMPWTEQLSSRGDDEGFARVLFEKTFGDQVKDCAVRVSDAPFGDARMCCAVDRRLIAAIEQAMSRGGIDAVSIQPLLMSAFNRWRAAVSNGTNCLVLAERERALLAFFGAGRWLSIRAVRASGNCVELIRAAIAREAVALGLGAPPRTYLYSTLSVDARALSAERLEAGERNDAWDRPVSLSMAMLGT